MNKISKYDLDKLDKATLEKLKNAYVATVIFYFRHGDSLNVARNKASGESTVQKGVIHNLCKDDPRLTELSCETKRKINEANMKFKSGVKMSDEALIAFKENERVLSEKRKGLL